MAGMTTKQVKTPVGKFMWAFVDGEGKENYNKDGFIFTINLLLKTGSIDEQLLVDTINDFWEENKPSRSAKPKTTGYRPDMTLDENGNRITSGDTSFTFSTSVKFRDGNKATISILNRLGGRINLQGKRIGNGSTGVVHGSMGLYSKGVGNAGVTLFLNAVQLATLVEYGTVDADEIEGDDNIGVEYIEDNKPASSGNAETKQKTDDEKQQSSSRPAL